MVFLLYLVIVTCFGSLVGSAAKSRGRRFLLWFLFGGLSPLLGALALLLVGDSKEKRAAERAALAEAGW